MASTRARREEASAAWAKAQAMIAKVHRMPTDAELRHWYLDAAAPCPWIIQVTTHMGGREYPVVADVSMLQKQRSTETMPMWRLVEVPMGFRTMDPSEILAACLDGRIAWQKQRAIEAA